MTKKPIKEDPVWSILPSYDMFHSTFNFEACPPDYPDEELTISSRSCLSSTTALPSSGNTVSTEPEPVQTVEPMGPLSNVSDTSSSSSVIVADQNTTNWRETILDNINTLRNISNSDNPISQNIDISVHFTEDVVQIGVAPKIIEPSQFEYTQGDYVNGYVLLKNNSGQPIPFEMFYVLFEGRFIVKKNVTVGHEVKKVENIKTFLEMYDFAASWTPLQVSRLLDENNKHYEFRSLVDPIDNSASCIDQKIIKPGVLYKRLFTFKIPENLLDTQCNDHNLRSHTLLPPSMGLADEEIAVWSHKCPPVSDFSFIDSSIGYGVMAQFIGKASKFDVLEGANLKAKLTDSRGDEFIIFKQATTYLRLILEQNADTEAERVVNQETTRVLYENLIGRIQEKIRKGKELQKAKKNGPQEFQTYIANHDEYSHEETCHEFHKNRQLYTRFENSNEKSLVKIHKPKNYELSIPILKSVLLRQPKFQGMFSVRSPRTEYILNYLGPQRFGDDFTGREDLWQMQVPLEIFYVPAEQRGGKVPEITCVQSELVVFTMQTENHPFPIELSHDLLFKNKSEKLESVSSDTFLHIVQNPMRQYGKELSELVKGVGGRHFQFESSLQKDMAALANARTKENRLNLRESKLIEENGTVQDLEKRHRVILDLDDSGKYRKKLTLLFNALKAEKKSLRKGPLPKNYKANAEFCLDPSFQTCFMLRMYYIRIVIHLTTGDRLELKLPVTITKMI